LLSVSSFDDVDGFVVPENLPPLMSLSLQSRDVLELTVTKSFLGVLTTLNQSFTEISDQSKKQKRETANAPLIIKNSLGKQITVILDNRSFKYYIQVNKDNKLFFLHFCYCEFKVIFELQNFMEYQSK
jgi:hypothetical protein